MVSQYPHQNGLKTNYTTKLTKLPFTSVPLGQVDRMCEAYDPLLIMGVLSLVGGEPHRSIRWQKASPLMDDD